MKKKKYSPESVVAAIRATSSYGLTAYLPEDQALINKLNKHPRIKCVKCRGWLKGFSFSLGNPIISCTTCCTSYYIHIKCALSYYTSYFFECSNCRGSL